MLSINIQKYIQNYWKKPEMGIAPISPTISKRLVKPKEKRVLKKEKKSPETFIDIII